MRGARKATTDRGADDRLDAMLAPLRDRPAELDELTQARVRGRLEAAIADDVSPAETGKGRGRRIAGVAVALALGAAAVFAVAVSMRSAKPRPAAAIEAHLAGDDAAIASGRADAGRPTVGGAGAIPPTAATERAMAGSRAASDAPGAAGTGSTVDAGAVAGLTMGSGAIAPIAVAAGQSAQVMVGGAAVTVYGPGQLSPMPDGVVAEGTGVMVDRTEGDRLWSMRYHGATVVAMRATFALDLGNGPRVTVVRGEISLLCSSGARTIRAGGSGSCPREDVRAAPRAPRTVAATEPPTARRPPALPALAELRGDAKAPMSADAIDRYAGAEAALRRGDVEGARRALLALIAVAPDSLDAATALLDLARLAASRAETASALEYLERLDRHPRGAALAAAAAHLRASLAPSIVGAPTGP